MRFPRTALTRHIQKAYQKALQEFHREKDPAAHTEPDRGRREFITTAALAAAALAIPDFLYPLASAQNMKGQKYSVAIIGGGIAGLTAANAFFNARNPNINVTVYEASARAGGRMYTQTTAARLTRELGGEFIDTGHLTMHALIREFGLEKINCAADNAMHGLTEHRFFFGEKLRSETEIIEEFKKIIPAIRADKKKIAANHIHALDELDKLSLEDYLKKLKVSGWFYNLLYWVFTAEFGLSASEISSLNFIDLIGVDDLHHFDIFGESDEVYKIKGGNELLIKKLSAKLGTCIKTGYQLTAVQKTGSQYSLSFAGQENVMADYILLTLPFTMLRNVTLDAALELQAERLKMINDMQYGTNSKLLLETDSRAWRARGSSGYLFSETIQNGWDNSQLQHDNTGAGGYTVFLGGHEGAALSRESVNLEQYKEAFYTGFNLIPRDIKFGADPAVFNWSTQQYTRGSYACYKTGQWNFFRQQDLMKPAGNIYFAGEHCSVEFQGFMNGAAETGNRAAVNMMMKMAGKLR
jgi:monoamine oxidase